MPASRPHVAVTLLPILVVLLASCGSTRRIVPAASSPTPSARGAHGTPPTLPAFGATTLPATAAANFAPYTPQPTPAPTRAPNDLLRFAGKEFEPLPADYVPPDLTPLPAQMSVPAGLQLRATAAQAYAAMWQAAREDGVYFVAVSTYRSYTDQVQVYANEVATFGQARADSESAQPGRSEHQLGLAIDLSTPAFGYALDETFARSPEGMWIAQHAADYGYVISYPEGKDAITGYRFEPWHIRYVGVAAARAIVASGATSTEALESWRQITVGPTPLPATPTP
jgi:zinc D-Ala-D-Ala carboxypeptidase